MKKTKEERQEWWYSLTDEQRILYTDARKAKKRENCRIMDFKTPKLLERYPWYKTGVNGNNREMWLFEINLKNPWLNTIWNS